MTTVTKTRQTGEALVSQEQLLPFLLNPKSYPHRPRRVRLVQTHSSFVFIAPPFVYKVKKASKLRLPQLLHAGKAPALLRTRGYPQSSAIAQHLPRGRTHLRSRGPLHVRRRP